MLSRASRQQSPPCCVVLLLLLLLQSVKHNIMYLGVSVCVCVCTSVQFELAIDILADAADLVIPQQFSGFPFKPMKDQFRRAVGMVCKHRFAVLTPLTPRAGTRSRDKITTTSSFENAKRKFTRFSRAVNDPNNDIRKFL